VDFADLSSNNFTGSQTMDVGAYVRSGRTFVMLKASEGVGYHWGYGDTIAAAMHGLGGSVGRYHWLRPDADPIQQADYFLGLIDSQLKLGDELMVDFEVTDKAQDPGDGQRADQLNQFAARVHTQMPGYRLGVYTGNWYLEGKPQCIAAVSRLPVYLSDYSNSSDGQINNRFSLNILARQYTNAQIFPGLPGRCDANRWLNSYSPSGGGTPITNPTEGDEDDMPKNFHVKGQDAAGNPVTFIVRNDLTAKIQVATGNDEAIIQRMISETQSYEERSFSQAQLNAIPTVKP